MPHTMPKDPNWKRRQHDNREIPFLVTGSSLAFDSPPVNEPPKVGAKKKKKPAAPVSRQRQRAWARRQHKQPLGMKQRVWHEKMGFPMITPRRRASA